MKSFPFIFEATISYYDDQFRVYHTYKIAGVGSCKSYTDAMNQIETRYKDELVSIEKLQGIGEWESTEQSIIPIKREWVPAFLHEDAFDWEEEVTDEK